MYELPNKSLNTNKYKSTGLRLGIDVYISVLRVGTLGWYYLPTDQIDLYNKKKL